MSTRAGPSRSTAGDAGDLRLSRTEIDFLNLIDRLNLRDVDPDVLPRGNDTALALSLLAEDARRLAQLERDRDMARRIATEDALGATQRAQGRPAHDLRVPPNPFARPHVPPNPVARPHVPPNPVARPQVTAAPPRPTAPATPAGTGGSWMSSISSFFSWMTAPAPAPSQRPSNTPVSSGHTAQARPSTKLTGHDCVACQDPIRGVEIRGLCGHYYDKDCIMDLVQSATRDESLFPPRCCRQAIPFEALRPHMSLQLAELFVEKQREFGTLKRVYCASATCSRFLGAQRSGAILNHYTCNCSTRTCGSCKTKVDWALGHVCRKDAGEAEVLEAGRRAGWARCPGCEQMIELNMGCYHMTCRCKTEFCYVCKARWKTCACPQWDERRLFAAAEARVDERLRRAPAAAAAVRPPAPPPPQARAPPPPARAPPPAQARAPPPPPARAPAGRVLPQVQTPEPPRPTLRVRIPVASSSSQQRDAGHVLHVTRDRRSQLVREAMDDLRVNHECSHTTWRYRKGGGVCQTCFHNLPQYLFRCGGCEMLACNRCRRNRL